MTLRRLRRLSGCVSWTLRLRAAWWGTKSYQEAAAHDGSEMDPIRQQEAKGIPSMSGLRGRRLRRSNA